MNWYKKNKLAQKLDTSNTIDDLFADWDAEYKKKGEIVNKERKTEPYTFELYRGFDADLESLEKAGESFVLSPKQSEQGMMWFTHKFINGYDPIKYVTGRGQWLLTYPLQAVKHFDVLTYEDGSTSELAPDETVDQYEPTENSRGACFGSYCLELPDGWYWTYKTEKFIATTNKITVTPNMIAPNK